MSQHFKCKLAKNATCSSAGMLLARWKMWKTVCAIGLINSLKGLCVHCICVCVLVNVALKRYKVSCRKQTICYEWMCACVEDISIVTFICATRDTSVVSHLLLCSSMPRDLCDYLLSPLCVCENPCCTRLPLVCSVLQIRNHLFK